MNNASETPMSSAVFQFCHSGQVAINHVLGEETRIVSIHQDDLLKYLTKSIHTSPQNLVELLDQQERFMPSFPINTPAGKGWLRILHDQKKIEGFLLDSGISLHLGELKTENWEKKWKDSPDFLEHVINDWVWKATVKVKDNAWLEEDVSFLFRDFVENQKDMMAFDFLKRVSEELKTRHPDEYLGPTPQTSIRALWRLTPEIAGWDLSHLIDRTSSPSMIGQAFEEWFGREATITQNEWWNSWWSLVGTGRREYIYETQSCPWIKVSQQDMFDCWKRMTHKSELNHRIIPSHSKTKKSSMTVQRF